jgi:hypothetical protein
MIVPGSILLLGTLAFAAGDCGECTLEAGKVTLCRTHDKAEGTALRRLKKLARSKEVSERAEALKSLATLSAGHANAPSLEAALMIGAFLEEEQAPLRIDAVEALLAGQHPEVVVATLSAEVATLGRDWKVADKYLMAWADSQRKGSKSYSAKENAEFMSHLRVVQYGDPVLRALGKLPDERSVAALVTALGWPVESTPATFFLSAARSALELHSRAGAEAVIGLLERLDEYLAGDPPMVPYGLPVESTMAGELMIKVLARPMSHLDYLALTESLRTTALAMGLSGCPAEAQGPAGPWKEWFAAHASSFRTELGTLANPVQVQLERN